MKISNSSVRALLLPLLLGCNYLMMANSTTRIECIASKVLIRVINVRCLMKMNGKLTSNNAAIHDALSYPSPTQKSG